MVRVMDAVSIHEAKTQFSRLVARAEAGEEIVVRRGPTPVAKIVAYHAPTTPRRPGGLKDQIVIGDDFDAMPSEFDDYTA
jgi:prevent-host-death family protein